MERREHANYSADQKLLVCESVCPKRATNTNNATIFTNYKTNYLHQSIVLNLLHFKTFYT